jgi:hypothetical protein
MSENARVARSKWAVYEKHHLETLGVTVDLDGPRLSVHHE